MKAKGKIIIVCVFISLMSLTVIGSGVKAQSAGTVIINPDGSVSGTSLLTKDGNIYRLSGSIYDVPIKGDNNIISQNQIVDNYGGVMIYPSTGTAITENNFTNNNVDLNIGTMGNKLGYEIYDNNFINNADTTTVLTDSDALGFGGGGTLSSWDNGSIGNYWSDYKGDDANGDGIGDTPYSIRQNPTVTDRYPLMTPFNTQNANATSRAQTSTPTATLQNADSKAVTLSAATSPNQTRSMIDITLGVALIIVAVSCVIVFALRNK